MTKFEIRTEQPRDFSEVYELIQSAFNSQMQADLVETLRETAEPTISLVASSNAGILGHIFFSPMTIVSQPELRVAQLSPISVLPFEQSKGIGAALIQAGHDACLTHWVASFLVGDPRYYKQFGYELVNGRFYTQGPHDPYLQLLELERGSLESSGGRVEFHRAFSDIEDI